MTLATSKVSPGPIRDTMLGILDNPCYDCNSEEWFRAHWNVKPEMLGREPKGETPCPTCDGSGYVLTPTGRSVLELFQRHMPSVRVAFVEDFN